MLFAIFWCLIVGFYTHNWPVAIVVGLYIIILFD
jgi:hypothetical protein